MATAVAEHEVMILGGGVAGLSASLVSRAPVYEAADRSGGVASSDSVGGFTFDRGIHVLQTRNERVLKLFDDLGIRFRTNVRNAFIYAHGQYSEYPFQVNTANLPLALRAKCVWGFIRREANPEPTNYEEWIYRSVGKGFADTFLIPYSEKFWGISMRDMTFEWTGSRVPSVKLSQVLRGAVINRITAVGTNATFKYPASGPGYDAIASAIARSAGPIHTGWRATHIDPARREIEFAGRGTVRYGSLVNTIPIPELIAICPSAPDEIRTAARQLRTNSIYVVNLGIRRAANPDKHWVHFPEKDISFFRLSFPHNFADDLAPPGMSSVSCEVSYPSGRPPDRKTIIGRVTADLIRVGVLRQDDEIVATSTHDISYAYCLYTKERARALATVNGWLEQAGIIPCGRYGLWTYFWSDEAIASGLEVGEKLVGKPQSAVSA
ncbi:MAG: FAD-dependent oxidoreductase [Hyphomicrobiaceae bacterium]